MNKKTTLEPIERLLRAWLLGKESAPEWYNQEYFQDLLSEPANQWDQIAQQHIHDVTNKQLRKLRPSNYAANTPWQTALQQDFASGNKHLQAWSALYHRYLLGQNISVEELAQAAGLSARQFRRMLLTGIHLLEKELLAVQFSANATTLGNTTWLPTEGMQPLVGIKPLLNQVIAWLSDKQGPAFISLEGIGGIGKTSLAQASALTLQSSGLFEDVLWISARNEFFAYDGTIHPETETYRSLDEVTERLAEQVGQGHLCGMSSADKIHRMRPLFNARPYLVVIDNLETAENAQTIVRSLQPLGGRSRFLCTSRQTLNALDFVQVLRVPELSFEDSCTLLQNELKRRQQPDDLSPSSLRAIYDRVGGLPLALKLIAAQLRSADLDEVLSDLQTGEGDIGTAFTHIYRRSWSLLSSGARQLLLSMLLISPNGEDRTWLRQTSNLPEKTFRPALNELLDYSLVETGGSADHITYRLHRLTITFLHSDILHNWQ